jgi:hypothetical protein
MYFRFAVNWSFTEVKNSHPRLRIKDKNPAWHFAHVIKA